MTLRYDDIPPQLPKDTPRVDPDGSASEFQFESEAAQNAWFLARAQDLNTKITTVSDSVDGAYAAVTNEATARASADSALATNITTVTTQLGTNTAALAVLQGSYNGLSVLYSVTGTINGTTGGFQFSGVTKNDGTASYGIEFDVSDFKIVDPATGSSTPVFSYSGTLNRFVFNAPVYVGETEIGAGASNDVRSINYTGQVVSGTGTNVNGVFGSSTRTITVTTKTVVLVSGFVQFIVTGSGGATFAVFLRVNGSNAVTGFSTYSVPFLASNTYNNIPQAFPCGSFILTPGTYTVDVWWQYNSASPGITVNFIGQTVNLILFRNVT